MVFREGGTVLDRVPVEGSDGGPGRSTTWTRVTHTYTATFVPTDPATYAGSASPASTVIVKMTTTTTLSASAERPGRRPERRRHAVPAHPPATWSSGEGGSVVGTVALDSGTATLDARRA